MTTELADRIFYMKKALRAYRVTTYGQFDRETHHVVKETQDAANLIESLEAEIDGLETRVRDLEFEINLKRTYPEAPETKGKQ